MNRLSCRLGLYTGGPDLSVSLDDGGNELALTFRSGRLCSFDLGGGHADLRLRSEERGLLDSLLGAKVVGAEQVAAADADLDFAPIHPFDCGPQLPGSVPVVIADLIVQHGQYDSPVGDIHFYDHFVGGLLAARIPGVAIRPDAIVQNHYNNVIRSNTPDLALLEAMSGAYVAARHASVLLTLAVLYANTELRSHLNCRRPISDKLCALAHHTRHPKWLSPGTGT